MRHLSGFILLMACGSTDPEPTPTAEDPVETPVPDAGVLVAPSTPPKPCPTTEDGDRPGDNFVAGPWIRDCNAPWKREYYRVHLRNDGTAHVMPRFNNTPEIDHVCKTASADLRGRLDRYGWCDNSVDPERIDHMTVDDALALAHQGHLSLKFGAAASVWPGAMGVWPPPMTDDAILVCGASKDSDILEACFHYLPIDPRVAHAGLLGGPSDPATIKFAAALNRLYGIR